VAKRTFKLTEQQVSELWRAYDDSSDSNARTRYQAVRLYGTGYPLRTIKDVTGCSTSSLREWVQVYRHAGRDGLADHRTGGNAAKLTSEQRRDIEVRLNQFTPQQLFGSNAHTPSGQFWTVEDVQDGVRRWFGVQYQSRVSYYNLLHGGGFSYQRTEKVFKSQRSGDIAAFQEMVEKN
jgi:transposase